MSDFATLEPLFRAELARLTKTIPNRTPNWAHYAIDAVRSTKRVPVVLYKSPSENIQKMHDIIYPAYLSCGEPAIEGMWNEIVVLRTERKYDEVVKYINTLLPKIAVYQGTGRRGCDRAISWFLYIVAKSLGKRFERGRNKCLVQVNGIRIGLCYSINRPTKVFLFTRAKYPVGIRAMNLENLEDLTMYYWGTDNPMPNVVAALRVNGSPYGKVEERYGFDFEPPQVITRPQPWLSERPQAHSRNLFDFEFLCSALTYVKEPDKANDLVREYFHIPEDMMLRRHTSPYRIFTDEDPFFGITANNGSELKWMPRALTKNSHSSIYKNVFGVDING